MAAQQANYFIGMSEGDMSLTEMVVYLTTAAKSNSLRQAYLRVQEEIRDRERVNQAVLFHLCNPITPLMNGTSYGKSYKYTYDHPEHFVRQQNLFDSLQDKRCYIPSDQEYKRGMSVRLKVWRQEKKAKDMSSR